MSVDPAETSGDPRVAIEQVQLADQRLERRARGERGSAARSRVRAASAGDRQRGRAGSRRVAPRGPARTRASSRILVHETCSSRTSCARARARAAVRRSCGSSFDAAVGDLGEALEGVALSAIARAFGELSEIARELAREIERIDSQQVARRRAG